MMKTLSTDLRGRVVDAVSDGMSHRRAAEAEARRTDISTAPTATP